KPANQRIAIANRGECRQPAAHGRDVVSDDGGEQAGYAVCVKPFARPMQVGGTEIILIEVNPAIAVDLQIEKAHGRGACPPRPAPPIASSSSFVQGRVRLVVAARTSFTVPGSTGPAAFPHCRRVNVSAPAI